MGKAKRDEFPEPIKKALSERVNFHCSKPDCWCTTAGPNADPHKATRIGVAAHITAAAKKGPRYDENLTAEQRKSVDNGIWLCENCADRVDDDRLTYPTELLREWRQMAEARADREIGIPQHLLEQDEIEEGWQCPFCSNVVPFGFKVCRGCHAQVIYGKTVKEQENEMNAIFFFCVVACVGLMYALPFVLASEFHWNVRPGWGMGFFPSLICTAIMSLASSLYFLMPFNKRNDGPPRFFLQSIT